MTLTALTIKPRGASTSTELTSLKLLEKKGEPSTSIIKEMQPFAVASKSIYSSFDEPLPQGWTHILPSEATLNQFKAEIPGLMIDNKGHFSTKDGLVAGLFLTENNQICLAFGGTTSGEVTGSSQTERSIAKFALSGKQWLANAKNALSGTKPEIRFYKCYIFLKLPYEKSVQ